MRVLVIDDEEDVARVIERALTNAGMHVDVATSGADGLADVVRRRPDVIVLDLDLPDAHGFELLPSLSALAPVVVLTGTHGADAIVKGLQLGADDYVTKPFSGRELAARVEAAARHSRRLEAATIDNGRLQIDLRQRTVTLDGATIDLTRRELDVLAYLAARPGVVVSRDELLAGVWASSAEWQTSATVTEHVRRVRAKLGDERWIETLRGVGYRFVRMPAVDTP